MTKSKNFFEKLSITQELIISVIAVIFLMISLLGFIVAKALIKSNEEKIAFTGIVGASTARMPSSLQMPLTRRLGVIVNNLKIKGRH